MRLTSLVLVVSTFAFAETRSLPSVGVGIGVGANTSSRTVEAPVVIFGGASLVREERTRMETSAGVTLVREPVVHEWGAELIANLLFSGARAVTFEPVLSALVELNAGPTLTLGAGPTVNLVLPAVDGAIISASFGARSLVRVQADVRLGTSQPRVDLGVRFDLVGAYLLVRDLFGVMRVSSVP